MLLHDLLLHAQRTSAARTAIIDGDVQRCYGEITDRIRRAAAGLSGMGLVPGQRVAVISANTASFFEAYFALSLAGLIAVPINIRLSPSEVAFMLDDCNASAVVIDDAFKSVIVDQADRVTLSLTASSERGWESLIRSSEPLLMPLGPQDEDATAHIFYTGGTTGTPKGVMLSHRNISASATNKIVLGSFARDDVWLHAAPMFHQADSWAVFSFTGLGATHAFLPTFAPGDALDLIKRHRITSVQLVPTMIFMMLSEADVHSRDLSSLRRVLYGSAPMPTQMLKRAKDIFGDVFQHIYGLTEAAGTVAATPWPPESQAVSSVRLSSCGQPVVGVDMRIADANGYVLAAGKIGQIQVRGATVMRSYWNRPAETEAALVDGWLDTGDLGHMDRDGYLFIVDRAKDMIISGGENVYSTEVENAIYAHHDVAEVAVIGVPDEKWGEAVTAIVVPRPAAMLDEAALIAHCRATLAGYKCPKSVKFVASLPKSATGKILKHNLRKSFMDTPPPRG